MKNKKNNIVEASWELFLKTGDPFYLVAKNTFEKLEKDLKEGKKKNIETDENGIMNI